MMKFDSATCSWTLHLSGPRKRPPGDWQKPKRTWLRRWWRKLIHWFSYNE